VRNSESVPAHEPVPPKLSTDKDTAGEIAASFGIPYLFPYQRLVVSNILEDGPPYQIVILPTGAGKSLCFQLPAMILTGVTVIVYPILSLMSDQLRRFEEQNIPAEILRGGQTPEERGRVYKQAQSGRTRVIISNPETLLQPRVLDSLCSIKIDHLVIDEAHCICEWGETFRPSYLELHTLHETLGITRVTAFTATASPVVLESIHTRLFPGKQAHLIKGNPDRTNIRYWVRPVLNIHHGLVTLLKHPEITEASRSATPITAGFPDPLPRPALVFCPTRATTESTARMLRTRLGETEIRFYHAGLSRNEKSVIESWFFASADGILCATCAYGMGVDKADIRSVVHFTAPESVESYLQESGRAGRDRQAAWAVLLYNPFETENPSTSGSTPSRETPPNPDQTRDRTAGEQSDRIDSPVTSHLGSRKEAMRAYPTSSGCRREFLLGLLDGVPENCSGCDYCCDDPPAPPAQAVLSLLAVQKNARRYGVRDMTNLLSGRKTLESRQKKLFTRPLWAALSGLHHTDIASGLGTLITSGYIRLPRRGPYAGGLVLSRTGRKYLRESCGHTDRVLSDGPHRLGNL
jgi:ATP-dependent DNA helicase RecQ